VLGGKRPTTKKRERANILFRKDEKGPVFLHKRQGLGRGDGNLGEMWKKLTAKNHCN